MQHVEAERDKLEAGEWERVVREEEVTWRNPKSLFLYPQSMALRVLREEANRCSRVGKRRGGRGSG